MSRVYIIKSHSYRALERKINEIIGNNNKIIFDLEENDIRDIFEEANYVSLFNEEKFIVVKNMKYFSNKGEYKNENEIIEKYLKNEQSNVTIIFIVSDLNLKNRNVKTIDSNNNLIVINEYKKNDLDEEIKKYIKQNNFIIDYNSINLLKTKCINNYDIILNELDKLFLIKKDNKIILKDIEENVSNMLEDNFEFINTVASKNINMFKYLDELKELKIEPTFIVGQLVNQYKLIYYVKDAINYTSEESIASNLKVHPYRIKVARENSFNYTITELDNIIDNLIKLDLNIKDDFSDKYQLIRIFLLELIK